MKSAAVIGLGTVAPIHLDAIAQNPNITLVGVCDILTEKKKVAPDGTPFFTDYREMIRAVAPDVVHLCLPHHLHVPVALESVEMGVNVFCEKPIALNAQQGRLLVDLERRHPEVHIGICLQNRMNETVERLKGIIDSGEYGRVTGAKGIVPWHRSREYYESKPWRSHMETAGGGCMINQSIHTIDLLYYLGGEISRVKAAVTQLLDYSIEVEDTVAASLSYANGAEGLFLATVANYKDESVQISVGLEKAEFAIINNVLYRIHEDGAREKLVEDARLPGTKFYYGASHVKIIAQFYAALEQGSEDYLHARDGLMSIQLIDAIQESGRTGRAVAL